MRYRSLEGFSEAEQREMGTFGAWCVAQKVLRSARSGVLLYFRDGGESAAWTKANIGTDASQCKLLALYDDDHDNLGVVLKVPEWKDTYREPEAPAK